MTVAVGEPLHSLSSCLGSVRGSVRGLDDQEIVRALREIEELSRRTQSVMLDVVAEADIRGIAAAEGFGNTARLLAGMLRLSAAEARIRREHAALVGTRRTMTGEPLPPLLPAAAALAAGQIGTGQLRVITETMAALPTSARFTPRFGGRATLGQGVASSYTFSEVFPGGRLSLHCGEIRRASRTSGRPPDLG